MSHCLPNHISNQMLEHAIVNYYKQSKTYEIWSINIGMLLNMI